MMEDEIEDIVGEVKLTDSQKSVATSNVYTMDFTDSCSDKNSSSGMDTYVIEMCDSDDSDLLYPVHEDKTVIDLKNNDASTQCIIANKLCTKIATGVNCCVVSQETFTQTSKTIIELSQANGNRETLETQTSFVSIKEERTLQYRIEMSNPNRFAENNCKTVLMNTVENEPSKLSTSDSNTIKSDNTSEEERSSKRLINIFDAESKEYMLSDENHETQYENTSDFEESNYSMEQDSLMEVKDPVENDDSSDISDLPRCIDNEIEELYNKLTESRELHAMEKDKDEPRHRTLTPLTEESIKRESIASTDRQTDDKVEHIEKDILFTNVARGKVKMLPKEDSTEFKLPPIQNHSCPNSPHLNFLFSVHPSNEMNKADTLPCLYEASERELDRWNVKTNFASGENPFISGSSDAIRNNHSVHLPPIQVEGYVINSKINKTESPTTTPYTTAGRIQSDFQQEPISIQDKIKDLKMASKCGSVKAQSKYKSLTDSRSLSPSSGELHESKLCDAAERGCDALCVELLRRLRSTSWYEVSETLEEIPQVLEKFWTVIAEQRIADLIRQVSALVESPRTHVARSACDTLACILKNTNYTKKPDFYEAVNLLLTKTGSFSQPVRRAANVALDTIVSRVELSHAVTALCVHGIDHKSPLVRCAAARLLVVSCALAGGGRDLLRTRPPTAVSARRHTLRALALLLNDKNVDARRYAERLYSMLRPLANFEAYYLTDVEVEVASQQMKKYDRSLLCGSKDAR